MHFIKHPERSRAHIKKPKSILSKITIFQIFLNLQEKIARIFKISQVSCQQNSKICHLKFGETGRKQSIWGHLLFTKQCIVDSLASLHKRHVGSIEMFLLLRFSLTVKASLQHTIGSEGGLHLSIRVSRKVIWVWNRHRSFVSRFDSKISFFVQDPNQPIMGLHNENGDLKDFSILFLGDEIANT